MAVFTCQSLTTPPGRGLRHLAAARCNRTPLVCVCGGGGGGGVLGFGRPGVFMLQYFPLTEILHSNCRHMNMFWK